MHSLLWLFVSIKLWDRVRRLLYTEQLFGYAQDFFFITSNNFKMNIHPMSTDRVNCHICCDHFEMIENNPVLMSAVMLIFASANSFGLLIRF